VVDPKKRLSVGEALKHTWLTSVPHVQETNLMPIISQGFNARKTFKKAVSVVKAVNKLTKVSPPNSTIY
jgi:calcium/calmodulin-dependent protein kinase I